MVKIKRPVSTGFWIDKKVLEDFSVEDRYFMLYLLTNPYTTQIGIYELPLKIASVHTGYSIDVINVLLERFENKYKVIKRSGDEIAIKHFLVHSIIKGGKPVEDCLKKEFKNVKDKSLVLFIRDSISDRDDINETVKKFLNGTDEDDCGKSLPLKDKPTKHKYGEYKNVLLTDEEYDKLMNEFPDTYKKQIENLSCYMASTGKSYKSHLATIRNWERKKKQQTVNNNQGMSNMDRLRDL